MIGGDKNFMIREHKILLWITSNTSSDLRLAERG
jgi:hypothetical protein